jgi:hypothetical protein
MEAEGQAAQVRCQHQECIHFRSFLSSHSRSSLWVGWVPTCTRVHYVCVFWGCKYSRSGVLPQCIGEQGKQIVHCNQHWEEKLRVPGTLCAVLNTFSSFQAVSHAAESRMISSDHAGLNGMASNIVLVQQNGIRKQVFT